MAIPFNNIITSPTVQFRIGPKKESFNLHVAPITAVSEPLDCIVDDAFGNSRNKHHDNHVLLASEDPDTFARFAQYVYTRDYSEPESKIDLESVDWEDTSSAAPRSRTPQPQVQSSEAGVQVAPCELGEIAGLWERFASKVFPSLSPVEAPGQCNLSQENYNSALIGHVKVYNFAQKYEVEGLADLAMKKLHATLCSFTLYPERVPEISKLLRFVHLILKNVNDPLRTLVMSYAECVIMELVKDQALLVNGPPSLTLELVAMLKNRANAQGVSRPQDPGILRDNAQSFSRLRNPEILRDNAQSFSRVQDPELLRHDAQSGYQLEVPEILRLTPEGRSGGNISSQQAHGPVSLGNEPRVEQTNQPRGEGGRGYESTYEEGQFGNLEFCTCSGRGCAECMYEKGQFENLEVFSCAGGDC